jgi:phosphoglycolate phosphatase-like HAD superfamily hydrolase
MGAQSSHELNDNFSATNVRAVIFDLGGVVVNSPIKALLDYEASLNLPKGTLWKFLKYDDSHSSCATFERNMITFKEFCRRTDEQWQDFIEENRITETVKFSALDMVVAVDKGQSQPVQEMLVAIDKLRKKGVVTMALTNKWYTCPADQVLPPAQMLPLCTQEEQQLVKLLKKYFDVFVESRYAIRRI